jgi:ribokinase
VFEALRKVDTNSIVVMPDFFVDRILTLRSQKEFCNLLAEKVRFGGGAVRNIGTTERKGGNAVNIAYCLARLGIKNTNLFTIADEFGSAMLRRVFSKFGERVNLRIEYGKHGRTTGLEFLKSSATKANVMLNDAGDNEYFGSEKIDSDVNLKILENANAVIVVNWGSNLKGSQLATFAFSKSPKSFHYIDPADIESRKDEFRDFLRNISNNIHALALNENEANSLGNSLGLNSLLPPNDYDEADVKSAAVQISSNLSINTDVHTPIGAASSNGKKVDYASAFEVQAKTLTGAGDSWDSANIRCYLSGISTRERLMFSNAYASLYVQSSDAEPPTMEETLELLDTKTTGHLLDR